MFTSLEDICKEAEKNNLPFWKVVQVKDCLEQRISEKESFEAMKNMYLAMKKADIEYDSELYSPSMLSGGDGEKVAKKRKSGGMICGDLIGKVMEKAIKMGESNACMKRIVAAPTAGSCGVVPAVLLSVQEKMGLSDDKMIEALYITAGIGGVIASRASLSGASGGCQAEIGSASSMAAGAIAYVMGGTEKNIVNAAALAMKNLLGLACDPVAGLVEVPCVKRNVIGAVNALTSADLAMAGVESKIPPDEVYDAMRSIGRMLPEEIRETGKGGLAGTPTGQAIMEGISKF